MKKKLLSMLLVGVTAMSMLAGCGGSSEEPKKEDTKTEAKDDKEEKKELDVVNVAYMPNYYSGYASIVGRCHVCRYGGYHYGWFVRIDGTDHFCSSGNLLYFL